MTIRTIISDIGLQESLAFSGSGVAVEITHMAWGDVSWNPTKETAVGLQNERERVPVSEGWKVGKPDIIGTADLTSGFDWFTINQEFGIDVNNTGLKNVSLAVATTDVATTVTAINAALANAAVEGVVAYIIGENVGIKASANGIDQKFALTAGTVDAIVTLGWSVGTVIGKSKEIQMIARFHGPQEGEVAEVAWIAKGGYTWAVWSDNSPYSIPQYEPSRYVNNKPTASIEIDEDSYGESLKNGLYRAVCTDVSGGVGNEVWTLTDPDDIELAIDVQTGVEFTSTHFNFLINEGTIDWSLSEEIGIRVYPYKTEGYKSSNQLLTLSYNMLLDTLPAESVTINPAIAESDFSENESTHFALLTAQVNMGLRQIQYNDRLLALEN